MDAELMNRLCAASVVGQGILKSPQDLCVIPDQECLAVADDYNGILIFSIVDGQVKQHIKLCTDAVSICFNETSMQIVVSVSRAVSKGDATPYELHFYKKNTDEDQEDLYEFLEKVKTPSQPQITPGYTRWITAQKLTGNIYMASGDNNTAALWKFDVGTKTWKTILERQGDLEHPCILAPFQSDQVEVIVNCWDTVNNWTVKKFTFDDQDKVIGEKTLIFGGPNEIQEPWCSAAEPIEDGRIYIYDYATGHIWSTKASNLTKRELVGFVKAGQWVSIEPYNKWFFVNCCDEGFIRGFRPWV